MIETKTLSRGLVRIYLVYFLILIVINWSEDIWYLVRNSDKLIICKNLKGIINYVYKKILNKNIIDF